MKIYNNYPLLKKNTFRMNVKADCFVEYDSVEELQQLIREGRLQQPLLHIGQGSNLLFTKDYEGMVLHSAIRGVEVVEETAEWIDVKVGAGVVWDDFVAEAVERRWNGAENLSLIPGEVGASAVQNIGAYGVEVKDLIVEVECVDLQSGAVKIFKNADCHYAYRQSIFKNELKGRYAVVWVTYRLLKQAELHLDYGNIRNLLSDKADYTAKDVRDAIIDIRNQKLPDPKVVGNAGSFFMNPIVSQQKYEALLKEYPTMPHYEAKGGVKIPAGWLIDQCGLKGYQMGRAAVHDKQALVLVNKGGASSDEIVALSRIVQEKVKEKFGIDINAEVNFI